MNTIQSGRWAWAAMCALGLVTQAFAQGGAADVSIPEERELRAAGTLATVVFPASSRAESYPMDMSFLEARELSRMLMGELTPRSPGLIERYSEAERQAYFAEYRHHATLLIWTIVNRQYFLTGRRPTRTTFMSHLHRFSQPINPEWRRDGSFCRPGGRNHDDFSCSEIMLEKRDEYSNMPWSRITPWVREIVLDFLAGRLPNPEPRVMNFAVYSSGMCRGHSQVDPRVMLRISSHGFCGTRDLAGYDIDVIPGAWARNW